MPAQQVRLVAESQPGQPRDERLQSMLTLIAKYINTNFTQGGTLQTDLDALADQVAGMPNGTVTNVATTSPITGGPITGTGTIGFDSTVLNGPLNWTFVSTSSASYTVLAGDVVVFSDCTSANTAVVLPAPAATTPSRIITVRRAGAVNKVTLSATGGANIDGSATQELGTSLGYGGSTVYSVTLCSDGTEWKAIAWAGKTPA